MCSPLIAIGRRLARETDRLVFGTPVTHVYNPLTYARAPHEAYLERYGVRPRRAMLVGMNPGPFGMAQTGVPFGEVGLVRDFLGIEGPVSSPSSIHPKRPIYGFACTRSEVSGARLWGFVKDRFRTPEAFFETFFVANYCPLVFVEESGKNRTPDKLPAREQSKLFALCDRALEETAKALRIQVAVGIGAFAERRCQVALKGTDVSTHRILHPSPASPAANRGWAEQAEKQLAALGLL